MSKWIYLSYPLNSKTPAYGGGDSFKMQRVKSLEQGGSCNTQSWLLSNHLGTHIDFPKHFLRNGKTLNDYPPDFWIFNSPFIVDISSTEHDLIIQPEDLPLDGMPDNMDILIVKTGFGRLRDEEVYCIKNPGFAPSTALFLRKHFPHLRVFGFDSISLSSFAHRETGREAHLAFLNHDRPILLLEDMDLSRIDTRSKLKQIIISPLLVEDADGAPCTILADIDNEDNTT